MRQSLHAVVVRCVSSSFCPECDRFSLPTPTEQDFLAVNYGRSGIPVFGTMILEAAATLGGVWALRRLVHVAILRGLRAPRLGYSQTPDQQGLAADLVRDVRIPGPRGRTLFGWLVLPSATTERPVPALLVMHGWGANAGLMWPVVPSLHCAAIVGLRVCNGTVKRHQSSTLRASIQRQQRPRARRSAARATGCGGLPSPTRS